MKKLFLALFICSLALSPLLSASAASLPPSSGFAYWPQAEGDTIQYNVFTFDGVYNPATMIVSVTGNQVYRHNMLITTSFYGAGGFASYAHAPGTPNTPINMATAQVNAVGQYGGNCFVGEAVNEIGNVIYPPEPKLACKPVVGQTFDVYSTVYRSQTDHTVIATGFRVRYKTLSYNATLDQWTTALAEIGADGRYGWVGNITFRRGVGIVSQFGGVPNADNTITNAVILWKNP